MTIEAGRRVLVTGGTGLVGSHLVAQLVESGYRVTVVCRVGQGAVYREVGVFVSDSERGGGGGMVDFVEVELTDYAAVCAVVDDGYDVVYHCAARVSFSDRDRSLVRDNVEMTSFVVDACVACGDGEGRGPLLVYVSSIATLGSESTPDNMIDENSVLSGFNSASLYAQSKFLCENLVWRAVSCGLRAVVVNASVVFGVGCFVVGDGDSFLLRGGGFLDRASAAVRRGPIWAISDGAMGFVDVRDLARVMVEIVGCEAAVGQRFVVNGANRSFREVAVALNEAFGWRSFGGDGHCVILVRGAWLRVVMGMFGDAGRRWYRLISDRSYYDGSAICGLLPGFRYTAFEETVNFFAKKNRTRC